MNNFVERVGWVLVHSLWQFGLIALLAVIIVRAMRLRTASSRYLVLVGTMAVLITAPVATWLLQPLTVPDAQVRVKSPRPNNPFYESFSNEKTSPETARDAESLVPIPLQTHESSVIDSAIDIVPSIIFAEPQLSVPLPSRQSISLSERIASMLRPWFTWIVAGWSLGVVLCSLRPLLGWRTLRRLKRVGVSPVPEAMRAALRRVSAQLGVSRTVEILLSSLAQVPIVVGYFKPVILLPISFAMSIPPAQLEAILAHELAHVRRHDFIVNLLQTLVETLFFYHPAVWWLSQRIRIEREHCCDDMVVRVLQNRVEYGRALVAVEELRGRTSVLALGAADGSLLARVRRIVGVGTDRTHFSFSGRWPIVFVGLLMVGLIMKFSIGSYAGDKTQFAVTIKSIPVPKREHYIARLPDGRSVEIVGIAKNTRPASEGWRPDGRAMGDVGLWPSTIVLHSKNTSSAYSDGGPHPEPDNEAIDFLFRFRGLKSQPSITFNLPTNGTSYHQLPVKDPYQLRVSTRLRGDPHPGAQTSPPDGVVRVGLTDEPWGKWLQISPGGEVLNPCASGDLYRTQYEQVRIERVERHERSPNKSALVLRQPKNRFTLYDFQIRGIDPDGKEQWVTQWEGSNVTGTDHEEGRWGLASTETNPLSRYEIRLRPYRNWVTFENVSLLAGKETDVTWKSETLPTLSQQELVLTTLAAWQSRIAERLPEWMQPLYNHGLLATLDDNDEVESVTTSSIVTDTMLEQFKTLPQLRELHIEVTKGITQFGLAHLAEFPHLEKLTAYNVNSEGPGLGDEIIRNLVGVASLRELSIGECGTTDAGAKFLEQLPQLTSLSLRQEGKMTDEAMKSIRKLSRLESLSLDSYVATERFGLMRFSATGIKLLSRLKELRSLRVVGQEVPAEALELPKLTSLSLGHPNIDDAVAAKIGELRGLQNLELSYCRISDVGLKSIADLPELRGLNISSLSITDSGIDHFHSHKRLERISLRASGLTDESLKIIAEIKTLTDLDLSGSGEPGVAPGRKFSIAGLQRLKRLPKLETLRLTNFNIPGDGYAGLKDLTHLRELTMTMCNITDVELETLEGSMPNTRISHMTGGGGWVSKKQQQAIISPVDADSAPASDPDEKQGRVIRDDQANRAEPVDVEKLLDELASAELPMLETMWGNMTFGPNQPPPAGQVIYFEETIGEANELDPLCKKLIDLGPTVAPAVNKRLALIKPSTPLAAHLAIVLRFVGNADSVPALIDLLKRGEQDNLMFEASKLAATSALWTLTGRQHLFASKKWEQWWSAVKTDYVVHRDRSLPAVIARVTSDRVTRLIKDLANGEDVATEQLLVLGPIAVPQLVSTLEAELKGARVPTDETRPMAHRLAWVIDELGATDKLPVELRRDYFIRRFAEGDSSAHDAPIKTSAVCRALSTCSFADFCSICLMVENQQAKNDQWLRTWMAINLDAFTRRFDDKTPDHAGDPAHLRFGNKVTPATNPAAEIADAVPVIIESLLDKSPAVRSCAARLGNIIGFCSDQKPKDLIISLRDAWLSEAEDNRRLDIGLAMCRFSSPIVMKAISDGLRSHRKEIVSDSAGLIDWVKIELSDQTRPDFERLVELTHDEDEVTRRRATESLSRKAPKLLAPELERLGADKNDQVRFAVAVALRSNTDPKFADLLLKLADDANEQIRINALSSISSLKDPEVMPRIVPFLRDKQVYGYAVAALVDIGGKDALPLLMDELKSGNDVGGMIYQHLRRLSGETFEQTPEPWRDWWIQQQKKKDEQATVLKDGLEFLKPYTKLHGLSLEITEKQFLEIHSQQGLKSRKSVDGDKIDYRISLGDDHTLVVMFRGDGTCSGVQRIRGEDAEPIKVMLKLKRQLFRLGESIAVEYEMTNEAGVDAPYGKGAFYPELRINDGFRISAVKVDENGNPFGDPVANWPQPQNHEGKSGGFKLSPGEKYSTNLFVTRHLRYLEPGRYRLRIENIDRLDPATVYSVGETLITLKLPTPDEARSVFERHKMAPRQAYDDNAMNFLPDAADFQAMHQSIYLPILKEYALKNDLDALESLRRMERIEANEILIEATTDALDRNDWRTARACFQHLKGCLPFPNWFAEPLNDDDKANRDKVARTWKPEWVAALTRLARLMNVEVGLLMQERDTVARDTDAKDPDFLKFFRNGFFPPEHPQSLLTDIDFIYRCIGQPEDFNDCLTAFAHSIGLTKTLPLETRQYFRPRGSASGFRHTVMYLLKRGAKAPTKPVHPGEVVAFAYALFSQPDFRPDGWQAELMKWLKGDTPYLAELILTYLPDPVPNEVLDYLPAAMASDYIDLQIAACHVARKNPRPAYRQPLQKMLDTAEDEYLRKYAVDAARANGLVAIYDANAPFVDASEGVAESSAVPE